MIHSSLKVREATADEKASWNDLVAENPTGGDFVAVEAYAKVKRDFGWDARHLIFEDAGVRKSVGLVLERKIPALGRYWYMPRTPSATTVSDLLDAAAALRKFAAQHRVFAVTIEPPLLDTEEIQQEIDSHAAQFSKLDLRQQGVGLQPHTSTTLIDIDQDDDALIASFSASTRTKIRRGIKDGLEVREYPATEENFQRMLRLQKLVGGGQANLRLRPDNYASKLWSAYSEAGLGKFYGIDVDGEPAVMAYTIRVGENAFYKDGGSDRPRTTPSMSNLLQWKMMQDTRDAGAKTYDMVGTPPAEHVHDKEHPNYSVGQFKLRFSKHVTEYIGVFDLVIRTRRYQLWTKFGLSLTRRLHMRKYADLDLY